MAVGIKAFHKERVANQVMQNIIGLQQDMVRNAQTHKAMAQVSVAALAQLPALQAEIDRLNGLGVPESDPAWIAAVDAYQKASAKVIPVATLRTFLNDCAAEYLRRLQWVIDLRNDPVKRQRLLDILAQRGWDEQEIVDTVTTLRNVAVQLRDAPKGGYPAVITICDGILAAIEPAESLWPE